MCVHVSLLSLVKWNWGQRDPSSIKSVIFVFPRWATPEMGWLERMNGHCSRNAVLSGGTLRPYMRLVMPSQITGQELNEHEWECDYVSEVLPLFFPHPTSCFVRVGREGGSDGGGTSASPPSYPDFPLSLNVVNECCMRSLRPVSWREWT